MTRGKNIDAATRKTARKRFGRHRQTKRGKPEMTSGQRFWGVSARVVLSVFAALLVVSCASVLVNPAKLWLMNLMGLLFLPLFLMNVVLLVWTVRRRSMSFVIPLIAIAPACFFFSRYVQIFNHDLPEPEPSSDVRLLSYNVGRFALSGKYAGREECADSLFLYLSETDSDIICLQEFYGTDVSELKRYANRYLPEYTVDYYLFTGKRGCFGNVTLSRLPVKDKGKILFPESRNLAIYTEYVRNGERFRVYNCHLESYAVSLANIWKMLKGDRQVFQETGVKMRNSITKRPRQVDNILSHIENCDSRSFVCGDFNDSPISNTYYRVSRGRTDSFVSAGHGIGASYRAFWPLIRIDYIFCPKDYAPLTHYTPKVKYSDHYPVISDILMDR